MINQEVFAVVTTDLQLFIIMIDNGVYSDIIVTIINQISGIGVVIDPVIDNSWSYSFVAITSISNVSPQKPENSIVFSYEIVEILPEFPSG